MPCKKCKSANEALGKRGSATTVVCADCGAFIRWGKKGEELAPYVPAPTVTEDPPPPVAELPPEIPVPAETPGVDEEFTLSVGMAAFEPDQVVESEPVDLAQCDYCDKDYVIPISFDGGIATWDNIEHNYCPICGRKVR